MIQVSLIVDLYEIPRMRDDTLYRAVCGSNSSVVVLNKIPTNAARIIKIVTHEASLDLLIFMCDYTNALIERIRAGCLVGLGLLGRVSREAIVEDGLENF